jgi:hypothetical protein
LDDTCTGCERDRCDEKRCDPIAVDSFSYRH